MLLLKKWRNFHSLTHYLVSKWREREREREREKQWSFIEAERNTFRLFRSNYTTMKVHFPVISFHLLFWVIFFVEFIYFISSSLLPCCCCCCYCFFFRWVRFVVSIFNCISGRMSDMRQTGNNVRKWPLMLPRRSGRIPRD